MMASDPSKKRGFASHTVIYAVGNVARQIVGFLMLPIYTRFLSPADFGAVGLLSFALSILEPFIGARLASGVPKFYFETSDPKRRSAVMSSALILTGSISAISACVIFLLREPASNLLFGTAQYALITGLFGLNILTQPIEHTGMTFVRLQERSLLFLWLSLGKLALQVSLNVVFVIVLKLGVLGVVLSGVISSAALGVCLTAYVVYYNRIRFEVATTLQMLAFSWPLWFAGLAGLYIASSNRLYLRLFSSLADVGLLELATRFASVVPMLLWVPFSQHWDTVSFRIHSEGKAHTVFPTTFIAVSTIMTVAALGIAIFSGPVIRVMAAEEFHRADSAVPFLTLGFTLSSLSGFFYFSLLVTKNTRVYAYVHYLTAIVVTVCYLALIPKFGVVGAAAGQCLAFAVTFLLCYSLSKKYFDTRIRIGGFFAIVGLAIATYAAVSLVPQLSSPVADLAVKSALYLFGSSLCARLALGSIKRSDPGSHGTIVDVAKGLRKRLLA